MLERPLENLILQTTQRRSVPLSWGPKLISDEPEAQEEPEVLKFPPERRDAANSGQETTTGSCACGTSQPVLTSSWASQGSGKGRGAEGKELCGGLHKECHP